MSKKYNALPGASDIPFIQTPKFLFGDGYEGLSLVAKVLYSLLKDRLRLSIKNRWADKQGTVYLIYTREDMCKALRCSQPTVRRAIKQLKEAGLIDEKRQGLTKPNLIYLSADPLQCRESQKVHDAGFPAPPATPDSSHGELQVLQEHQGENQITVSTTEALEVAEHGTGLPGEGGGQGYPPSDQDGKFVVSKVKASSVLDCKNCSGNNTEINKTDSNDNQSIRFRKKSESTEKRKNTLADSETYEACKELLKENIEYEALTHDNRYNRQELDEMLDIMAEAVCSSRDTIRVNREDKPAEVVKSRLLKLDNFHIEYVFDCLSDNTTKISNIRAYLLSALYNAPSTLFNYYRAAVNHDLYGGGNITDHSVSQPQPCYATLGCTS